MSFIKQKHQRSLSANQLQFKKQQHYIAPSSKHSWLLQLKIIFYSIIIRSARAKLNKKFSTAGLKFSAFNVSMVIIFPLGTSTVANFLSWFNSCSVFLDNSEIICSFGKSFSADWTIAVAISLKTLGTVKDSVRKRLLHNKRWPVVTMIQSF